MGMLSATPRWSRYKVCYGTFDTLSEGLITEQHGDLRQLATDYISQASCGEPPPAD